MTSFVLNSVSSLSRVLNPGETGKIGQSGVLLTTGTSVRINGAADLLNFGQLLGQGQSTVLVTAPGASVQNFGTLRNLLSGGTAINFATSTAISANLDVLNTGLMTVVGAGSHILKSRSGGVNLTNSGTMQAFDGTGILITDQNDGDVGNHIVNLGTIQAGTTSQNFAISLTNDDEDLIENTGLIRGSIETGGGNDTIINAGHLWSNDINLGDGDDLLISTGLIERLEGGPTVVASLGDGNDTVDVSASDGRMVVFGGNGDDRFIIRAGFTIFINEFASGGLDTLETNAVNSVLGDNIENLILYGDGQNGTGNELDNTITGSEIDNILLGQDGNDTLSGNGGNDTLVGGTNDDQMFGGAGNDQLFGENGNDTVVGGDGNDLVNGDVGDDFLRGDLLNDTINGSFGNDYAYGGEGDDLMRGEDGDDTLFGDQGDDELIGGDDNDDLSGGQGQDLLVGGQGNDALSGFTDDDALIGNAGNDDLYGDDGNDLLQGGEGADRLDGGTGLHDVALYDDASTGLRADIFVTTFNTGIALGDTYFGVEDLVGSAFNDLLLGDSGGNLIDGGNGADQLFGRTGNDTLTGGDAADTLFGNQGNDVLTGGIGADVFVFDAALGATNRDQMLDFVVVDDTIHLENAVFTGLTAGALAGNVFVIGAGATLASHRVIYNAANGQLLFDADGSGGAAAVVFATLGSGLALTSADFLVI